jgi:hypothetical protein
MQDFTKGVRDFIYLPEYKTGFVAMSDMNIVTRLDSYFTNFTMPWEKKNTKKETMKDDAVATVGALQHFKILEQGNGKDNIWASTPTWAKTYGS